MLQREPGTQGLKYKMNKNLNTVNQLCVHVLSDTVVCISTFNSDEEF